MSKLLCTTAFAVTMATGAYGAVYPTFQFDEGASSITVTPTGSADLGGIFIEGEFLADESGLFPWTPTSATDSLPIEDFIEWTVDFEAITGAGIQSFDVDVTLAFSDPTSASEDASGDGVAGSFLGVISGGVLNWDNGGEGDIDFGSIGTLDFVLGGTDNSTCIFGACFEAGFGNTTTTSVKFTGNEIAPVPLPAAGWMLLAGVGGLVAMKRRRKGEAAA